MFKFKIKKSNHFSVLAINNHIIDSIYFENVISKFSAMKARRKMF